jgi:hypothetical protein
VTSSERRWGSVMQALPRHLPALAPSLSFFRHCAMSEQHTPTPLGNVSRSDVAQPAPQIAPVVRPPTLFAPLVWL